MESPVAKCSMTQQAKHMNANHLPVCQTQAVLLARCFRTCQALKVVVHCRLSSSTRVHSRDRAFSSSCCCCPWPGKVGLKLRCVTGALNAYQSSTALPFWYANIKLCHCTQRCDAEELPQLSCSMAEMVQIVRPRNSC